MKVELINDDDLDIYVNPYNFNDISGSSKEIILNYIKEFISKINDRYKLNLSGFYKIKAYFNDKVGLFLNLIKIDDNEFNNEADFRIILFQNEKFFFETEDYDVIKNYENKKYYNNKFYVDTDSIDNINELIDMGKIVYGDEAREIQIHSKNIK